MGKFEYSKYLVASLLVAFFIVQIIPVTANEALLNYFDKAYLNNSNNNILPISDNEIGIIDWLPGQEFEILLQNQKSEIKNEIPLNKTPEYILENLEKKIKILQKPNTIEAAKTIQASVTEHNLPIAVLNVWRPHTVIKIKNETKETWLQKNTKLVSENFSGNLSFFRDPTWLSKKIITTMDEKKVLPGKIATFEFIIDGRGQSMVYGHVYKLKINDKLIHLDAKGALYWLTRVDPYSN